MVAGDDSDNHAVWKNRKREVKWLLASCHRRRGYPMGAWDNYNSITFLNLSALLHLQSETGRVLFSPSSSSFASSPVVIMRLFLVFLLFFHTFLIKIYHLTDEIWHSGRSWRVRRNWRNGEGKVNESNGKIKNEHVNSENACVWPQCLPTKAHSRPSFSLAQVCFLTSTLDRMRRFRRASRLSNLCAFKDAFVRK